MSIWSNFEFEEDQKEVKRRRARIASASIIRHHLGHPNNIEGYRLIALFLRGDDPSFDIMTDLTDEDLKKLELLRGPHGHAILKMGLARWGVSLK